MVGVVVSCLSSERTRARHFSQKKRRTKVQKKKRPLWTMAGQLTRSISFSGAGFYGVYHLGVTAALQSHGFLPNYADVPLKKKEKGEDKDRIVFMGSSAGSLVAAGTLAGFKVDDVMHINYQLSRKSYARTFNALTPGFDLLCELEPYIKTLLIGVDPEIIPNRMNGNLHVHLTSGMTKNRIVDEFQDVDHLLSSLILSCYIPGVTGRAVLTDNSAVGRATKIINEKWGIKKTKRRLLTGGGSSGDGESNHDSEVELEVVPKVSSTKPHSFIDGGLSRNWPFINKHTILVSPVPIQSVVKTRHVICPQESSSMSRPFQLPGQGVITDVTLSNMSLFAKMLWATDSDKDVDKVFQNGYDDAMRFLKNGGSWH
jgi:hypothetical protein